VKTSEFRRWLKSQGAEFKEGSNHTKRTLNGKHSTLPRHSKDLPEGNPKSDTKNSYICERCPFGGFPRGCYRILREFTMKYPFSLPPDGPGYLVTFPVIPEAISYGETKAEAIDMAYDCLHCFKNVSYVDGIYTIPRTQTRKKPLHERLIY